MIHIGKQSFYRRVARQLRDCDMIVAEGDDTPSSMGRAYQIALRATAQRGAKALTSQDIDFGAIGVPLVWPDAYGQRVRSQHLRRIPVIGWLDVLIFAPILTVSMAVGGRRIIKKRHMEVSDDSDVRLRHFTKTLIANRDAELLKSLESIHEQHHDKAMTVAVVYGAGHMPAVIHGLRERFDYRARSGEWLSAIDF